MKEPVSKSTQQRIQRIYERPRLYDSIFSRTLHHGRKAALEAIPQKRPLRILEVGIGTGLSLPFYPAGIDVVGIDPSIAMLRVAKEKVVQAKASITLQQMDGGTLTFPDASFEVVLFLFVLSVAPDPTALLREAQRVLRPGGLAIIANHFQGDIPVLRILTFFTKHLGYHTKLRVRDVTALPGWRIVRNDRVALGRLLILQKSS